MNGYTTSSCLYNLHHPIEPSKLPFNWIHILDNQIFFNAVCICAGEGGAEKRNELLDMLMTSSCMDFVTYIVGITTQHNVDFKMKKIINILASVS